MSTPIKISRRAFLVSALAASVAPASAGDAKMSVTRYGKLGFVVAFRGKTLWTVTDDQASASFGSESELSIDRELVSYTGILLNHPKSELHLTFSQVGEEIHANGDLRLGGVDGSRIVFSGRRIYPGWTGLAARLSVAQAQKYLGQNSHSSLRLRMGFKPPESRSEQVPTLLSVDRNGSRIVVPWTSRGVERFWLFSGEDKQAIAIAKEDLLKIGLPDQEGASLTANVEQAEIALADVTSDFCVSGKITLDWGNAVQFVSNLPRQEDRLSTITLGKSHPRLRMYLDDHRQNVRVANEDIEIGNVDGSPSIELCWKDGTPTFLARAKIFHCGWRLPEKGGREEYAEYSRLDFRGQVIEFHAYGKPTSFGIFLFPGRAAGMRVPLDQAILTVMRTSDALRLRFGFEGMTLEANRGQIQLLCNANEDPSRLKVEFPPQHVQERAFSWQLANLPMPPDPAVLSGLDLGSLQGRKNAQSKIDPNSEFGKFMTEVQALNDACVRKLLPDPGCPGSPLTQNDLDYYYLGPENIVTAVGRYFARKAYENFYPGSKAEDPPVEARNAGVTRLVFNLPQGDRKNPQQCLKWSLASLLDWQSFDLAVTTRAERAERAGSSGLKELLQTQGISPSSDALLRMQLVAEAASNPDLEGRLTRIEVPSRLWLSPATDAKFRLADDLFVPGFHRARPIWRAELQELPLKPASLRAIGSPDFVPGAFDPSNGSAAPCNVPGDSWLPGSRIGNQNFITSLSANDRHQIVGLSSVYGLPVIPNDTVNGENPSQVAPPDDYVLTTNLYDDDASSQALYIPQALPTHLLTLSAMGASLDLDARFVPPASVHDKNGRNLFDAFSIERWRTLMVFGREITTEVIYKGYLCPLGHEAALVKTTERRFIPSPVPGMPVIAYLVQRLFIRVGKPVKTFGAVHQPYDGRGWPARSVRITTTQTPDLLDPTVDPANTLRPQSSKQSRASTRANGSCPPISPNSDIGGADYSELPNGQVILDTSDNGNPKHSGLIFWPRVTPGRAGDFQWGMCVEDATDVVHMPMLFVDNVAANDARTMSLLYRYYNDELPSRDPNNDKNPAPGAGVRRILRHNGARRRYAAERNPGDTTFETESWQIRIDSRQAEPDVVDPQIQANPLDPNVYRWFLSDAAMQGASQPPFFPRLQTGLITYGAVGRFTGNSAPQMRVTYYDGYLRDGQTVPTQDVATAPGAPQPPNFRTKSLNSCGVPENAHARRAVPDSPKGVATDTFLRVLDSNAKVGMGGNGDRSGVLAQPNQPIRYLARVGPIGGSPSALKARAEDQTPADPPAYNGNFFGDAKLLGIVLLDTMVQAALQSNNLAAPVLNEVTEYAGAMDAVIQNLEKPISGLKKTFESNANAIAAVYPDAYAALSELDALLTCNDHPAPNCNQPSVGGIVAAGLRLGQALERIVATPLASVEQKLISSFKDQVAGVLDFAATNLLAPLTNSLNGKLDTYVSDVWTWLQPIDGDYVLQTVAGVNVPTSPLATAIANAVEAKPSIAALPPRLSDLLASNATLVMDNVRDLRSTYTDPVDLLLIDQCAQAAFDAIATLTVPDVFNELYSVCYAVYNSHWDKFYGSLGISIRDILNGPQNIPSFDSFLNTLLPLISLAPNNGGFTLSPSSLYCSATTPQQLCNELNAIVGINYALAVPSQNLLTAMSRLRSCLTALPDRKSNLSQFGQWWRRLIAAWRAQADAFGVWVNAVAASDWTLPTNVQAYLTAMSAVLDAVLPNTNLIDAFESKWQAGNGLSPWISAEAIQAVYIAVKNALDALTALRTLIANAGNQPIDITTLRQDATMATENFSAAAFASLEDAVSGLLLGFVDDFASKLEDTVTPFSAFLACLYGDLVATRSSAYRYLTNPANVPDVFSKPIGKIAAVLYLNGTPDANGDATDDLTREKMLLDNANLADLLTVIGRWNGANSAPQLIAKVVGDEQTLLIRGLTAAVIELVDVSFVYAQVQQVIQGLVPSKITRSYGLTLPVSDYPDGGSSLIKFRPKNDKLLTLNASASVDLGGIANGKTVSQGTTFSIKATLSEFALDLADYLSLNFGEFSYTAGTGQSAKFSAPLTGIDIGPALVFLAALFATFAYGGDDDDDNNPNGPYVNPMPISIGIEAGYRLSIPAFSIGPVGFDNVNFDAHCDIPFDGGEAKAFMSLSTVESPFTISCFPYGGGGSIGASGDCSKFDTFSLSLVFGAVCIISYGPLEALGAVMTGFYIVLEGGGLSFYGIFCASFTGSVACFSVTASFYLQMGIKSDGKMTGLAILSYSFSVGFLSVTFSVSVKRDEGSSLGQGAGASASDQSRLLNPASKGPAKSGTTGSCKESATSPAEDWRSYRILYDLHSHPRGSRRRTWRTSQ